mmetsp:Transcript_24496/g.83749  ORF Transcript_24496/g.83749 Transcript_24496/m.83749 type:complete len:234 (-) Transcript_24496:2316-3017(-)
MSRSTAACWRASSRRARMTAPTSGRPREPLCRSGCGAGRGAGQGGQAVRGQVHARGAQGRHARQVDHGRAQKAQRQVARPRLCERALGREAHRRRRRVLPQPEPRQGDVREARRFANGRRARARRRRPSSLDPRRGRGLGGRGARRARGGPRQGGQGDGELQGPHRGSGKVGHGASLAFERAVVAGASGAGFGPVGRGQRGHHGPHPPRSIHARRALHVGRGVAHRPGSHQPF